MPGSYPLKEDFYTTGKQVGLFIMKKKSIYAVLTVVLLRFMAFQFNVKPSIGRYLKSSDGWINFSVGFKTETGTLVCGELETIGRRILKTMKISSFESLTIMPVL